jgi:hypothetical protein
MWETIRGYLTFTRKERFGVLFLLGIITGLFVLPYFFQPHPGDTGPMFSEKMKIEISEFEKSDQDSSRTNAIQNDGSKQESKDPGHRPWIL